MGSQRVGHNWVLHFHCTGEERRLPMQKIWETWVRSLGQEDPPEYEMTPHSSILAWKFPWTDGPGRPQSMRLQRVRHIWAHVHAHKLYWELRQCAVAQNSGVWLKRTRSLGETDDSARGTQMWENPQHRQTYKKNFRYACPVDSS